MVFLHRLALATGNWDVDTMAATMTTAQLARWIAYSRLEPFGDDWRRTGRLASITVAAAGAKVEGELEEKFLPGGGIYRGRNEAGAAILDELRKLRKLGGADG